MHLSNSKAVDEHFVMIPTAIVIPVLVPVAVKRGFVGGNSKVRGSKEVVGVHPMSLSSWWRQHWHSGCHYYRYHHSR